MHMLNKITFPFLIGLLFTSFTTAQTNLIVNGGLEDVTFSQSEIIFSEYNPTNQVTTLPTSAEISPAELGGWDRTVINKKLGSDDIYWMPEMRLLRNDASGYTATPYGNQFGFFADVNQTVGGLTIGQDYRFSGSAIINMTQEELDLGGYAQFHLYVYSTSDLVGGIIDNSAPPTPLFQTSLTSGVNGVSPSWRDISVTFTAPAEELIFRVQKFSGVDYFCNWDNIALVSVPEPSSAIMIVMTMITGFFSRRCK